MTGPPKRQYDPGATAPVQSIVSAVVIEVDEVGGRSAAWSATPNRAASLVSAAEGEGFDLLYHVPTYIDPQPGDAVACALTADACAGVFPLIGDEVRLPDGKRVGLATFAESAVGRPIADFYGIRAPIE
jgi:hypothetical protein